MVLKNKIKWIKLSKGFKKSQNFIPHNPYQ